MMKGKQIMKGNTEIDGTDVQWPPVGLGVKYDGRLTSNEQKSVPYVVEALVHLNNEAKKENSTINVNDYIVDNGVIYAKFDPANPDTVRVGSAKILPHIKF